MKTTDKYLSLIKYLEDALDSPLGIELQFKTNTDMLKFRQQLYVVKRKNGEMYARLSFNDHGTRLRIVKNHYE